MLATFSRARAGAAMFMGALALFAVACSSSGSSAPAGAPKPAAGPTPNPTLVAEGQALVTQKGCGACHTIPGIPGATGTIGPNLQGVATRSTIAGGTIPNTGPDDLKRWILDPPALKPGTAMPKLGLTDDEANKIVTFLETLR